MMKEIGTTEVWCAFSVKLASGMLQEAAPLATHITGQVISSDKPGCLGGVKGSSFGRFGGDAGIAEFTGLRGITIETDPQSYPF